MVPERRRLPFPPATKDLHHEIELVVALGAAAPTSRSRRRWSTSAAMRVGLDMTRRDIQSRGQEDGPPVGHGQGLRPIGADERRSARPSHRPSGRGRDLAQVNGEVRQEGDLAQQIWKVPETIAYLSPSSTLRAGDLIMTGTPAGVGRVVPGDALEGHIDGVGDLRVEYEPSRQ